MPVPSTQEIQRPLLEIFKDEAPHNLVMKELSELIADKLKTELDDSTEKIAFKNNINEAIKYLLKNKLLSHPTKTTYLITRAGVEFLDGGSQIENIDETPAPAEEPELPEEIQEIKEEISQEEPEEQEQEQEQEEEDFPVGFDEPEEIIDSPEEINAEEPQENEIPETVEAAAEPETPPDESGEINEPVQELEQPDDISLEDNENEIENQNSAVEQSSSAPEVIDENDDGIEIDDFDDFIENEVENIEKIDTPVDLQESQGEQENELEENEIETENEDLDEMNNTELETTAEAVSEMPEENGEGIEIDEDSQEQDVQDTQNSSSSSSDEDLSLEDIFTHYNENLAESVLERVENLHQDNFCMLVMDLLSKMDYRVFQTARYTNDVEGTDLIQGIILENKPGMNPIYIHARKLSSSKTVSKANMLDFVNALSDKGGKGMFVTTGKFSSSAEEVAKDEGIMLVDGKKLAGLMISYNFCVNTERVFELKAIDSETFDEYDS